MNRRVGAAVERNLELCRLPARQRPEQRVCVYEATAHPRRVVGDAVHHRVEPAARDAHEGSLPGLADVECLLNTGCEDLARRDGLARDPEDPAEVVAPATREDPEHAVRVLERAGDRPDQSVAPERHRDLAVRRRLECQLATMLEAARVLESLIEPEPSDRGLDLWESARRAAPAGHGINDEQQPPHRVRSCLTTPIRPVRGDLVRFGAHGASPRSSTSSPPPSGGIARGRPHVAARSAPRRHRRNRRFLLREIPGHEVP